MQRASLGGLFVVVAIHVGHRAVVCDERVNVWLIKKAAQAFGTMRSKIFGSADIPERLKGSQRELHKDGGGGGGGVAMRARAARAPKPKSCATSCGTPSATPSATAPRPWRARPLRVA